MDAVLNQVAQLITDQVDIKVEKKLSLYIDIIARKHGISRSELFKDLNAILEKEPLCQGLKKDGTRCKNKATIEGYCAKHNDQRRCTTPVILQNPYTEDQQARMADFKLFPF